MAEPSIQPSSLYNEDLAPVPESGRTWSKWSIAALWVGMAVCITTYNLASGLIANGMNWWQALITIALANTIVLIPMVLNGHPGTRYGIPFPVLIRASFGTLGANIPAVMRGLVACGWFGIQTWIGGQSIYQLHAVIFGFTPVGPGSPELLPVLGISLGQLGCFFLFWAVNIGIILFGMHSIKWLEDLAAPFLIVVGLVLLWWGFSRGGGVGKVLSDETTAQIRGNIKDFDFWKMFWPSLTAMVGYWATLSLNIPDFSRYAKSQKDQALGQLMGLPTTMALYSFIGIAVTCATVLIYGKAIWDPVELMAKFDNKFVVGFALFGLTIATLSTNLAANVVSPANDFANLAPRHISFKMGGVITGIIGIVIMPWKLISDLGAYIFTWLIGYSALLGSVAGVMLADYFIIRKTKLDVQALYDPSGEYAFGGSGFNWRAIAAMMIGIVPNVPGFLQAATNGKLVVPDIFNTLYTYAWFVGLLLSGISHVVLTRLYPPRGAAVAASATAGR